MAEHGEDQAAGVAPSKFRQEVQTGQEMHFVEESFSGINLPGNGRIKTDNITAVVEDIRGRLEGYDEVQWQPEKSWLYARQDDSILQKSYTLGLSSADQQRFFSCDLDFSRLKVGMQKEEKRIERGNYIQSIYRLSSTAVFRGDEEEPVSIVSNVLREHYSQGEDLIDQILEG